MNAEILAVGTELLMGQIANTNAQYISGKLPETGINVFFHTVTGDNPIRLKEFFDLALKRSDIVIMTGGLGPTQDDLTKETVAEIMGRKLVLHQESAERIKDFFKKINRPMVESNLKQAYMPEDCIILENNNGTAPGCIIENGEKTVIMLPGPPSEMKPMFENSVMHYLKKKTNIQIVSRFIRIFGIGESAVENMLEDMIDNQTNPTLATYAKDGEVTIRLTAKCESREDPVPIIEPAIQEIQKRLGLAVYSIEGKNMEQVVGELLIKKGKTVAFAESCTGGLVSAKLTSVAGISAVFKGSIVSYSNEIKEAQLGVKAETLEKYGAVSSQTALEMASGVMKKMNTDIGVSITGIAGPGGATAEKPVGLVYVAIADKNGASFKELHLWGSRERIRNVSVLNALDLIRLNA
ncbi:MAG: competence/damage-inducible protein A [Bacillota bacterium]|nr:competence/damage-inducible protein A [Bacillota bacterium]